MPLQQRQRPKQGTVVTGRWKGTKEEDEMERVDSSQTGKTICWSHNSWLEERARNLLVVVRSGRGEKLPARLDKTVLEIPVESKLSPLPTFPNKGSDLFSLFVLCESFSAAVNTQGP